MNTKLGMLKQAALAFCCVASVAAMPVAQADGFGVTVGTGPYYSGYYAPPRRCFIDYYGYRRCTAYYPAPAYYDGYYAPGYYSPGVTFGYYGSRHWGDRDDWRWRDRDDHRWHDRDGDRH
jgi:hypothetical protein